MSYPRDGAVSGGSEPVVARTLLDEQIDRNRRWTVGLLAIAAINGAFVALLLGSSNPTLMLAILALMAGSVVVVYLWYARLVMGATGARTPTDAERAVLEPMVADLARRYVIPAPIVMVLDDESANAFAIGRRPDEAVVVFTTGILAGLNAEELRGVAAHELAHIANGDTHVSMLSAALLGWALGISWIGTTLALGMIAAGVGVMRADPGDDDDGTGALAGLGTGLVIIVVSALVWIAIQLWFLMAKIADLAIHRQREYLADATAVSVTGRPDVLASALATLEVADRTLARGGRLAQALCVAGTPKTGVGWRDLMQTHPATEARIAKLQSYPVGEPAVLAAPRPPERAVTWGAAAAPIATASATPEQVDERRAAADTPVAAPAGPPAPPARRDPEPASNPTARWGASAGQAAGGRVSGGQVSGSRSTPARATTDVAATGGPVPDRLAWTADPAGTGEGAVFELPRWVADAAVELLRCGVGRRISVTVFGEAIGRDGAPVMVQATERALHHPSVPDAGRLAAAADGLLPLWLLRLDTKALTPPDDPARLLLQAWLSGSPRPVVLHLVVDTGAIRLTGWDLADDGNALSVTIVDSPFPAARRTPGGPAVDGSARAIAEAMVHDVLRLSGELATMTGVLAARRPVSDAVTMTGAVADDVGRLNAEAVHAEGLGRAGTALDVAEAAARETAERQRQEITGLESLPDVVYTLAGLSGLPAASSVPTPTSRASDAIGTLRKSRDSLVNDAEARADGRRRRRRMRVIQIAAALAVAAGLVTGMATGALPSLVAQVLPASLAGSGTGATTAPAESSVARATPSPRGTTLTGSAVVTPSPVRTLDPISTSAPPPPAGGYSEAEVAALTSSLAKRVRASCSGLTQADAVGYDAAITAVVRCTTAHATILAQRVPNAGNVPAAFAEMTSGMPADERAAACWDSGAGATSWSYGQVVCADGERPTVAWSDWRSGLIAVATGKSGASLADVVDDWWNRTVRPNPGANPDLTESEAWLMSVVPPSMLKKCDPYDATADHDAHPATNDPVGDLGAVQCEAPAAGVQDIAWFVFTSREALDAWYARRIDDINRQAGVVANSGGCVDGTKGETGYGAGRAICWTRNGKAAIRWTNQDTLTYGATNSNSGVKLPKLAAWWQQNGRP